MTTPKSYLQKLLRYPHSAVFDKSPRASIAFRMSAESGMRWMVWNQALTVQIGSDTPLVYDLTAFENVASLLTKLKQDGMTISAESPYFFSRLPSVLVEGSGDTSKPNGDAVFGFQSLLWAFFSAYAQEVRRLREQIPEALKQMVITSSEGEWLDFWGSLYGVPRDSEEPDDEYQDRIPEEAFRLRVNALAIEKAIFDLTGYRVEIRETWPDMFRLDVSRLSGTSRLPDSSRWRYGYIQPVAHVLMAWDDVLAVIERNKAAGVIILPPVNDVGTLVDGRVDGTTLWGAEVAHDIYVPAPAHHDWQTGVDVYHSAMNTVAGGTWSETTGGWPDHPWSYGNTVDDLDGTVRSAMVTETA